ncbi:MAG TPA: serine hydrolase, partial [Pirellulales bacterium]|nr:serine hydrolase [Pirellulales bacterium]
EITVRQLLTHQGGLIADNSIKDFADGHDRAIQRLLNLSLSAEPGSRFIYSDVGFMVLGELVRRVSGQDVHAFSHANIFQPLGLKETGYLPAASLRERAAPTEQRDGRWMQGEVHDPRAYALGGVAGHAGLFSTAEDLAVYAQMLLNGGEYEGVRILAPETVATMISPQRVPGEALRGLGWDMKSGYSSNRGETFSPRAVGHGGFTGTALWIDPELELTVIFLSNRLHPDGKGKVNPLAGRIGTIVADAMER